MERTVMIVEDDPEISEVLRYNLKRAGYAVAQQFDGKAALKEIAARPPDLVLLDVMLPGVDGWEICRQLAKSEELRELPVIVFTAKSARQDFDTARQFNVAGFFTKPYATDDVIRHVDKVLSARPQKNPRRPE